MAQIFLDSFDHYTNAQVLFKWDFGAVSTPFINPGRTNNSLKLTATGIGLTAEFLRKNISVGSATVIVGFAYKCESLPLSGKCTIASFGDTGKFHWGLHIDSAGRLTANICSSGAGGEGSPNAFDVPIAGGASPSGIMQPGVWDYIEIKTTIATATTGTVYINLNGVNVVTATGVATSTQTSGVNQFNFHGITVAGLANYFDDLYIYDDTTADHNDFAGDSKVVVSFPVSDFGPNQFTPSTAGAHYLMVNEVTPDGDVTYLADATVGDRELYDMQDLDVSVTLVRGVQSLTFARKDDATTRIIRHQLGDGGASLTDSTDASLGQTYAYQLKQWPKCPVGTVAWTPTNFNAIKAGVKVQA